MRGADGRSVIWNVVGAGALALIAAGFLDIPGALAAFTPRGEPTGAAFVVAGQLRWGAGVAASFLILRAAGLFKTKAVRNLLLLFDRGNAVTWGLVVLGVAFALRLAYAAALAEPPPVSDEQYYDGLARSLAAGNGYASAGVPTAYWPVGYPVVLATSYIIFGYHYLPVIILQAAIGAATAAGVYLLARALGLELWGRAAALLLALWPSQIAYASRLFPYVIFGFIFLASVYVITKYKGYIAAAVAGLLAGGAALLMPIALPLPVLFFLHDVLTRRAVLRAAARGALAAAVAGVVVAPWVWRNYRVFGEFIPGDTNGGVTLWMGNNPRATGTYFFPIDRKNPLLLFDGELERDREGYRLSRFYIRHNVRQFLLLTVPKFVYIYGADVSAFQLEGLRRGEEPRETAVGLRGRVAQTYYALCCVLFVLGLYRHRRRLFIIRSPARSSLAALLLWPAYLTAVYLVFFGQDRYHLTIVPFLAVLAGAAVNLREDP
ncbi:MAG TPA: hypothetical protein VMX79_07995 [bacterium]|nr:hypothetical protein [bacterium]